ncbi:MAG TPA: protein kinase [candidate division Zixibacteria bacterium]|nr:protein kinase [candidate division Zixibacteria bacterium]
MIGQTVSHYRIESEIGQGGMGVVFRALDTRLERAVALKFLSPQFVAHPEAKSRFLNEARAASALNHPNICTIYEIGEYGGQEFIAMEFVEGQPLSKIISSGKLPVPEVLDYSLQMAEGLEAAHKKGIIHRDVKPDNILVAVEGRLKIMDFGLAKIRHTTRITTTGTALGTAAYMSPEQARGEFVDARTDLFSLGMIMYEMLAGRHPFAGPETPEHPAAIIYAILHEKPEALAHFAANVPAGLETIILKALEKSPARRYQSAQELAADLRLLVQSPLHALPVAQAPIRPAVAVLHFDNMSDSEEDKYFAAGITEDIITDLSNIEGLRVASRMQVEQFRFKPIDLVEIGRRLQVDYVVQGSVRRAANIVRITAQLTKVADGFQIWSRRFDREMRHIFEIQDEVSKEVASALKVKLSPDDLARIEKIPTTNLQAYDYFLKGREYNWSVVTEAQKEYIDLAVKMFEKAIELDPDFAEAWAGLGEVYTSYSIRRIDFNPEFIKRAERSIKKALELAPDLAEAHRALGRFFSSQRRFTEAAGELGRAIELKPNYADAYYSFGAASFEEGKYVEALRAFQKVLELRPTFFLAFLTAAETAWVLQNYELTENYLKRCDELVLGHFKAYDIAGWLHIRQRKLGLAREDFRLAAERCENPSFAETIGFGLILLSDCDRAIQFLHRVGNSVNGTNLYLLGLAYSLKGMKKEAQLTWERGTAFLEGQLAAVPSTLTSLMLASLALIKGAEGKFAEAFQAIRQGETVERVKPEEKATLKVAAGILHAQQKNAAEAVEALKNSCSKYYTAAEAALDPRLKSIANASDFQAYLAP